MDEAALDALVDALGTARNRGGHWALILAGSDGDPSLTVGQREDGVKSAGKKARDGAKDARHAFGRVDVDEDRSLTFVQLGGSAKVADSRKAIVKTLAKNRGLGAARPWLADAEVVEEEVQAPEGDGLGIDRRTDAEEVSKASKAGEKKLSAYVGFLESLDGWHALRGKDHSPAEARAMLDQIEARARAWHDTHRESLLESRKNKKRRDEVDRVLEQVAVARRQLFLRMGSDVTDEDREHLLHAEREYTGRKIEKEGQQVEVWKEKVGEGLGEGRYTLGDPIGTGTFGIVKPLTGAKLDPKLVVKHLTPLGRHHQPDSLRRESEAYGRAGVHPNLARCFGVREVDGEEGLILEALEGGTLESFITDGRAWVESGQMSQREYVGAIQHVFRGIIRAMQHLHGQGLGHHDLKPGNVMIDLRKGVAKVMDLGTLTDRPVEHQTPEYGLGDPRQGLGSDGTGTVLSLFEAFEGRLPDYGLEEVDMGDVLEEVPGLGRGRWDELDAEEKTRWRDLFSEREVRSIEHARRRLAKARFVEEERRPYVQGEGPSNGYKPMLLSMQDFANRFFGPPDQRPSFEELLTLPFLAEPLMDDDEGSEVLKRLELLRNPPPDDLPPPPPE